MPTFSGRSSKRINGRNADPAVRRAGALRAPARADRSSRRLPFARISASLLRWFRTAAREMEWRETRDPYRIWVSEIMLQQTRVETVVPYYRRFLARFPDVQSLASATMDDVLSAWEGLGYYARARNLHRAAGIVAGRFGGKLPSAPEDLMALPGIGRSTAGAISAIAFGRDEAILDANVRRVLARIFAVRGNLRTSSAERRLWDLSAGMVRKGNGRDTALALMDLGAGVCLPKSPHCTDCPLSACCASFKEGLQEEIPPKASRKAVPHFDIVAALFQGEGGGFLLLRRPPEGLLGGLWAFPSGRRPPESSLETALRHTVREKLGVRIAIQRKVGTVRHAYSHFRITLHGFLCSVVEGKLPSGDGAAWFLPGAGTGCALPCADRKLMGHYLGKENS
ncbi:MAG: A/G-specific adenine glycosylase [Deltaproteobacteria bacterium]|nr:A/G-specific adenine glycosylase [Deltaproteobacteria bacterium]